MNQSEKKSARALMREAIQRVAVGPDRGRDISENDAELVMHSILQDHIDEVQIAVFLIALRMKRESLDECLGLFSAMQESVDSVEVAVPEIICLADPFDGYIRHLPMSPFLPAVLASCGLPSLMHGVETVGPKHGITAHKVYKMAGHDVAMTSASSARQIETLGWSYLDQSEYASQLHSLNELRDRIVKRTALTTLERLLMPLRAHNKTHLVLGYVHKAYPQIYAAIAHLAGYDSALLIKGVEGGLTPALNKPLRRYYFEELQKRGYDFSNHGLIDSFKEVLEIGGVLNSNLAAHQAENEREDAVESCLELGLEVLKGKSGIARDSLSLAAGQILYAHGHSDNLQAAVTNIHQCLDSGKALALFAMK